MTLQELRERQSWTLEQKIDHSLGTIEAFVNRMGGIDKVYVSFSGGKDSTVLLHLVRRLYPGVLAVFCNTGNEYPDVIRFIRQTEAKGVDMHIIRPRVTPRQVWEKYGFPLVSKQISDRIHRVRVNPDTRSARSYLDDSYKYHISLKWRFLIHEVFETTDQCCDILKKAPFHTFEEETGRSPFLGMMASESELREKTYLRYGGCNVFSDTGRSSSSPLSIWLDIDIWEYIDRFKVPIADIYRKGARRTGCMGCGFGAHFPEATNLRTLYRFHPKCYNMVMNYTNNGVTFREALRKVLAVNGLYLPDEEPANLFTLAENNEFL